MKNHLVALLALVVVVTGIVRCKQPIEGDVAKDARTIRGITYEKTTEIDVITTGSIAPINKVDDSRAKTA